MNKALQKQEDALIESIRKKTLQNNLLENKNKDLKDLIAKKKQEIKSIKPEVIQSVGTIKAFKENKELQKREDILVESVRKLTEENNKLVNDNKYLKDLSGSLGDQIPNELRECVADLELKQSELKTIESEIETANEISTNAWAESTALDKSYKENKKSFDTEMEFLETKQENKIKEIDTMTNEMLREQEIKKIMAEDELYKIEKEKTTLTNLNQLLTTENMALKKENTNLDKDNKALKSENKATEESLNLLDKRTAVIEQSIEELEKKRKEEEKKLEEVTEKFEDAQKKLYKAMTTADNLVKKEDNLKSYEAYIIEVAARLGISYQPFQP